MVALTKLGVGWQLSAPEITGSPSYVMELLFVFWPSVDQLPVAHMYT